MARPGVAALGRAGLGVARQGRVRHGVARLGMAGFPHGSLSQGRLGAAKPGTAHRALAGLNELGNSEVIRQSPLSGRMAISARSTRQYCVQCFRWILSHDVQSSTLWENPLEKECRTPSTGPRVPGQEGSVALARPVGVDVVDHLARVAGLGQHLARTGELEDQTLAGLDGLPDRIRCLDEPHRHGFGEGDYVVRVDDDLFTSASTI